MIAQRYKDMLSGKSVIRQISEWSTARGTEIGYENVFDYSLGNPSVPCPEHFTKTCINLLQTKEPVTLHGYSPTLTIPAVRKAVAESLNRRFGMDYGMEHIFMATGAAGALAHAMRCVAVPGQDIITFAPFFPEYKPYVEGAGLNLKVVPPRTKDFQIDFDAFDAMLDENTAAVLINTPNNPTGAVYSEQTLRALGELAVEHGFTIISDEIYEKMVYDGAEHISTASLSPEIYRHCITINGFSKAYAMPGWRIGYSAAPLEVTTAIKAVQGHVTSAANSIAQKAALEALSGPQDTVAVMCGEYARRRSRVAQLLQEIPGVRFSMPSGAFYFWVDVSAYLGKSHGGKKINTAVDLANFLLEQAHAAVVPGEAFHMPGSIRISYANSMKNIELALTAIKEALALL